MLSKIKAVNQSPHNMHQAHSWPVFTCKPVGFSVTFKSEGCYLKQQDLSARKARNFSGGGGGGSILSRNIFENGPSERPSPDREVVNREGLLHKNTR